jgi:hypothetical protein
MMSDALSRPDDAMLECCRRVERDRGLSKREVDGVWFGCSYGTFKVEPNFWRVPTEIWIWFGVVARDRERGQAKGIYWGGVEGFVDMSF